tara:strand:+ start:727 stop:867 length:141 start_codon:yes stop_codon:yes gene_type:complete
MKKYKLTKKAKSFIKGLKAWNEKRIFDKLTPGQKTAYIKKLLKNEI